MMRVRFPKAARPHAAALWLLATAPAVHAQPTAPIDVASLRTMSLAGGCAQCHGTDGRAPRDAPIPPLAGMSEATFLARMATFRSGAMPSASPGSDGAPPASSDVMRRIAAGYSDAQLRALAAWFAAQPR
jgi:cytochrome c553